MIALVNAMGRLKRTLVACVKETVHRARVVWTPQLAISKPQRRLTDPVSVFLPKNTTTAMVIVFGTIVPVYAGD